MLFESVLYVVTALVFVNAGAQSLFFFCDVVRLRLRIDCCYVATDVLSKSPAVCRLWDMLCVSSFQFVYIV